MTPVAPCTEQVTRPGGTAGLSYSRAVGSAVAVIAASLLPVLLVATLAVPMGDELGFGSSGLGGAIAAFWGAATLVSIPAGRLVDRIGARRGVRLAGAIGAGSSVGIALAAHSYAALLALLALGGAATALAAPGMSAIVSRQMRGGREGSVLAFQQSGPPAATLLAGAALPLVAQPLGWRAAFAMAAGAVLVAVASVRAGDCDDGPSPAQPDAADHAYRGRERPDAVTLAVLSALGAAAASAGVTFFVPFAVHNGLGEASAGGLLAASAGIAIAVRVWLGLRADHTQTSRLPPVMLLLLVSAAGFGLLATGADGALVAGTVLALGVGWGYAGLVLLAAVEVDREAPGAAVGILKSGTYAGALAGPLLGGWLADAASLTAVWIGCAVLSAAAAAISSRPGPRRPAAARTPRGAGAPAG